jgi:predicted dehydrogenase
MSEKKFRVGIVGAGGRGIDCFGIIISKRDDAEIVALCDPNPVRMEYAEKTLGKDIEFYSSVEEMTAKEDLDAIVITSPDYCHEANAVAALKSGINVLIDKPLATTVRGCRNIISEAEKTGKILMMGFNLRHHQVLMKLKQIIVDGTIGRVFLIENREFYDGGRTYMSRWNRHYAKSGGLWIHKGSHDFDIFNWLLDFPKPVKVSAFAGVDVLTPQHLPFELKPGIPAGPTCSKCPYSKVCPDVYAIPDIQDGPWGDRAFESDGYAKDVCMYLSEKDTHDNGIAIVEYENGAKASHMECFITPISDRLYTVVGDRGQAEVSLEQRSIVVRPRWSQETITYHIPLTGGGHGGADPGLVESFFKALKGDVENVSTANHGMWATAIGQAAEISRRESRTVQVRELFK